MEAPRPAYDSEPTPFRLEFSISESTDSTEERPILFYSRNGFSFKVKLDLIQNSTEVELDVQRPESFTRDWKVLYTEVQTLANEELQKRREKYSKYFS